jgi:anthranilate synthase component 2
MLLMIDNYDSFTYNLVQYCAELGAEVEVVRNDAIDIDGIRRLQPDSIIISPGPCNPEQAGISLAVVRELKNEFPILGVCLGHQSIAQALGGRVVHARQVMHGKTSRIHHRGTGVFRDLPNPFVATRYHSLIAERASLPSELAISAWTVDEQGEFDEIMGLEHHSLPLHGVQFHPESILTEHGHAMLANFLRRSALAA